MTLTSRQLVNDEPVVAGVSMNLYRNEVTVVVGNKYSGKTTLINLLAGECRSRERVGHVRGLVT